MPRVGVFVCHCGINIAKTVDVKRVAEEIAKEPGVVIAQDYQYTCSVPGQQMIVDGVREHNLNRVQKCTNQLSVAPLARRD
jgi:heterodisulfide reductase subunit A